MIALLAVAVALAALLLAVVAVGALAGEIGALSGSRLERCPDCRRIGLAPREARVHPAGCPPPVRATGELGGGIARLRHH